MFSVAYNISRAPLSLLRLGRLSMSALDFKTPGNYLKNEVTQIGELPGLLFSWLALDGYGFL